MKKLLYSLFFLVIMFNLNISAQIDARLLQYPDVSETHITFYYGGDIYVVDKEGGTANKLTNAKGGESFPKFSPDGSMIAFNANYNGNTDIYTINSTGGNLSRLTHHGMTERVLDWYPKSQSVLFASSMKSGRQRYSQFYKVEKDGGISEKLPMAYGEFGSISPDEKKIAYTLKSRVFRTWKRYRGGTAPDIWIFDLDSYEAENITENNANDEMPMWHGDAIYYISDQGPNKRANIWMYDLNSKTHSQLSKFKDYDVHFPSIGPKEIVFEAAGNIHLLDLSTQKITKVDINIISDQKTLVPQLKQVKKLTQHVSLSPDGNRVMVEARGDIFDVPAEKGFTKNLTNTSGTAERFPAWAPNGKSLVYWSDQSGEYELILKDLKSGSEKVLTQIGKGYKYQTFWSNDSKYVVFIDNSMNIMLLNTKTKDLQKVDQALWRFHGGLENFRVSWSPKSKYFTFSRGLDNRQSAIFIYDIEDQKLHQITEGFYSNSNPVFDTEGKYIYFTTNRAFKPNYSDMDNSFIYPNSTKLAMVTLQKGTDNPLKPENDSVEIKEKEEKKENGDEKKESKDESIEFKNIQNRTIILPVDQGNYGKLASAEGKLVFIEYPNTGSRENSNTLKYFDFNDKKVKTIIDDISSYQISNDSKKILVNKRDNFSVISVAEKQKMDKMVPLDDMYANVNPKAEWKQIFTDAWRLERDFFYDPDLHGVNWDEVYDKYIKLVEDANTRNDVNYAIGEMIAELNASHTYRGGGDFERADRMNVGYLGIDWQAEGNFYKVKNILEGAKWDNSDRSPLNEPGTGIEIGNFILAVNGIQITTDKDPYAYFQGLAGKTVEITYNNKPSFEGSKTELVELLNSETSLRHKAWVEKNRKLVDKLSDGKIGYIYVRSTGIDGQNELVRQFMGQFHKKGLIIDERFNSGGQIPDRFIELLDRKPLAFWAVRDGKNWQWPPVAHFGPKAMLINGWSGSGGDAFPDYFRKAGLGKLIGTRTWGGLIGISGAPQLIDGGVVTVPTFRMYDPDGKWFLEGHGVDPDIEVIDHPTEMAKGNDPQLERAVEEVLKEIKSAGQIIPDKPGKEIR